MRPGRVVPTPSVVEAARAGIVVSVSLSPTHGFAKVPCAAIRLLEGLGVAGDAHAGRTVQHLYRVKRDAGAPNLAQVHFLHAELFAAMAEHGYALAPGHLGENVLTRGLDLITLPSGTLFRVGEALVEISGIRDPCRKIEAAGHGLTKRLIERGAGGRVVRRAGVMGVVRESGTIRPGDAIQVTLPPKPHRVLSVV